MTFIDWLLTLITLAAAFAVIQFCWKRRGLKFATLGIAVGMLSILYCANPLINLYRMQNLKFTDLNVSETQSAAGVPLAHGLPTRWTGEPLALDLAKGGRNLKKAVEAAGKMNHLLILDATHGVLPEYREWVETEFGKVTESPGAKQTVCFRRLPEIPYATGICVETHARFSLTPNLTSYAVSQDGRSSFIHVKHDGASRFAITTMSLDVGPEALCLTQLSKGSACAGIEILPDGALSALFVEAENLTQHHLLEEFHILPMQTNDISIQESESPYRCGGFDSKSTFFAFKLTQLKATLSKVTNESGLTQAVRELDKNLTCPGPASLQIPLFAMKNTESATRSFLTQLLEKPFWITPPESYVSRKQKIDGVTLQEDGYALKVTSPIEIKKFALTVMTPVTFNEDILHFLKPVGDTEFKVYRSGTTAFRIVTNLAPSAEFAIDTAPVIRGTSALNASIVSDWTGFNRSMLFALSLALIIGWLQGFATVRTERQVFFPMTFFYICFIGLLWSFLSYRASLQGSQGTAELTSERPMEPQYTTLRDWNEEWWKKSVDAKEDKIQVTQAVSSSWRAEVQAARQAANQNTPTTEGLKVLDLAAKADPQFQAQATVVVWDAPEVRNWYFRKSPAYASALTAWQSLLKLPQIKGQIQASSPLNFSELTKNTILIVLDQSQLSESNQKSLNAWVSGGGTVVYHSALDPALSPDPEGTQKKSYSKIPDAFGKLVEVNRTHYLKTKTGKWYSVEKLGSGRKVFVGLVPLQANSQHLLKELLLGLSHVEVTTNSYHADGCHSALLVEPYGASLESLRAFAVRLKDAGMPVQWTVSAESFARMAPEWKNSFAPNNVVFLDDGKSQSRMFAVELYRRFFKVTGTPVFVTVKDEKPNLIGPESLLIRAELMPSGESKESSTQLWTSSCLTGISRPRLLSSNEMKNSINFWQNSISALPAFHLQNAVELLENAALLATPAKRKWISSDNDPMIYEFERNSP
jgi:hypothetical protein